MNFREAEEYLLSLGNEVEAMKLGLENITTLLAALNHPQTTYLKVQVAGTNGKGSVCAFLDSICREAGIRTGLYTSPHLVSITERIKIDGEDISEDDFAKLAERVRSSAERLLAEGKLQYRPTFFEHITAVGLLAFAEAGVELAILETGLGGRYDAVTAARAEVAAITKIALDHQEYLGGTIEDIAAEKAAVIRSDSRVVVLRQGPAAEEVINGRCGKLGIEPVRAGKNYEIVRNDAIAPVLSGSFQTRRATYDKIELKHMLGVHQFENASVAVALAEMLQDEGFAISNRDICIGLENARHSGRLEYIDNVLLDGAHNVEGAKALAEYLNEFVDRPVTLIFGAMKDKDVSDIVEILFPLAENIVLTKPSNSRAMSVEMLAAFLPKKIDRENAYLDADIVSAIDTARRIVSADGIILVTGSLYLVGEVKKLLNNQNKDR